VHRQSPTCVPFLYPRPPVPAPARVESWAGLLPPCRKTDMVIKGEVSLTEQAGSFFSHNSRLSPSPLAMKAPPFSTPSAGRQLRGRGFGRLVCTRGVPMRARSTSFPNISFWKFFFPVVSMEGFLRVLRPRPLFLGSMKPAAKPFFSLTAFSCFAAESEACPGFKTVCLESNVEPFFLLQGRRFDSPWMVARLRKLLLKETREPFSLRGLSRTLSFLLILFCSFSDLGRRVRVPREGQVASWFSFLWSARTETAPPFRSGLTIFRISV